MDWNTNMSVSHNVSVNVPGAGHWTLTYGDWLLVLPASALCLFTIVSNVMVVLALVLHKRLRRIPATVLVLNLALADLLVGMFVMPLSTANLVSGKWPVPHSWVCRLWVSVDVVCCTASIVTLCAIALDRFLAITIPFQYKFVVTTGRACGINLIVWIYSIGTLLITLKYNNESNEAPESKSAEPICSTGVELEWVVTSTVLSFYIPSAIIGLVYVKVWLLTRSLRSAMPVPHYAPATPANKPALSNDPSQTPKSPINQLLGPATPAHRSPITFSRKMTKSERLLGPEYQADRRQHEQTLRMHKVDKQGSIVNSLAGMFYRKQQTAHANRLAAIILTFYVCWLPFFLCSLIFTLYAKLAGSDGDEAPAVLMGLLTWLGYANSALNPLVYAVTMKSYRHAFTALVCCATTN